MYKSVLQYIFMVGLPVLGVFGLLRMGAHLQPPVSLGGTWKLEFASGAQSQPVCDRFPVAPDDPQLTISQSGPHLEIVFNDANDTSMIGKVDGMGFIARQNPNLDADPGTQLAAELDRQAEPDRLSIEMSSSQCAEVQSMTAVRQANSSSESGSH
jgi:hypothetical protein